MSGILLWHFFVYRASPSSMTIPFLFVLTLHFDLPLCKEHSVLDTWYYMKFFECTMFGFSSKVLRVFSILVFLIVFIATIIYLSNLNAPSSAQLPGCISSFPNSTLFIPLLWHSLVVITYFFIHLLNLTENPQAMPRMQKPLKKYWLNGKSLQIYAINLN